MIPSSIFDYYISPSLQIGLDTKPNPKTERKKQQGVRIHGKGGVGAEKSWKFPNRIAGSCAGDLNAFPFFLLILSFSSWICLGVWNYLA
jgi:hypothetical protein